MILLINLIQLERHLCILFHANDDSGSENSIVNIHYCLAGINKLQFWQRKPAARAVKDY